MNKKQLKEAFEKELITKQQYKDELFKMDQEPMKKKSKKLPVVIEEVEFKKLMAKTDQMNHKVAFLLAFEAGLRISEVLGLEQRDIDMKLKRILVREGKGSKDRYVPLPKRFTIACLNEIPFKVKMRALEAAFKRRCKFAGLLKEKPTLHFHSLRTGFCSHCLKKGMPVHMVRDLMGHSNIAVTNVYSVSSTKEALESYENYF